MRGTAVVAPVGRLRPGVSVAAAQAEMDALVSTHRWENPSLRQHADQIRLTVLPLLSGIGILIRPYLWLILCAVWVVLGVTCANLSLMMLTRGQAARRDSAVSAALGASKGRLMALIFAETMILCAAGAAVGWLMAAVTHGALVAVLPPTLQRFAVEPADARVVLAALAAACGACALAALTPMVALARTDLWPLLQSGTDSSKRLGPLRGGSVLLAVEAAMGVVVLAGAVQTVPGFVRLVADQGMEPEDLFTATINHDWVDADGRSVGTRTDRVHAVNQVVTALPNVERAAVTLISPLGESSVTKGFWDQRGQSGNEWAVDAGFFRAMATPIIAGRELSTNEIMERSRVAVLNQAGLKALWPNDRPTAVIARLVDAPGGQRQVIGIAADFRGLSGLPPGPAIFLPVTADEVPAVQSPLVVFLRMMHGTAPDSRLLAKQLDAVFPSNSVQTASVADQMAPAREKPMFLALLFGLLSSLAILLNAAGLLAVTRFEAGRRRREMAVRLVLGAVPWQVRARLLFSVMSPVAAGTVAGVALTLGALHGFQDVLPDGGRSDPSTCLLAAMFILVTAVLAVTRPLVSSGRMQPAVALRSA